MSDISWYAHLIDLDTNTVVATTTEVLNPQFGPVLDGPGTCHAEFRVGTAFINAMIAALGGPTWQGSIKAYLFELFQDGGLLPDSSMWLEKGSVDFSDENAGIILDGLDIVRGFDAAYLDHATYIGVRTDDAMGATPGNIRVDSTRLMLASATLPIWWAGLYHQTPGKNTMPGTAVQLHFTAITNAKVAANTIDLEENSDSLNQAAGNALAAGSGVFDPTNPGDFGAHQHLVFDVMNRQVLVGYRNDTPVLTIQGGMAPSAVDETTEAAIVDFDTASIPFDLTVYAAQTEQKGGSSDHDMPQGANITGLVIINKPAVGTSHGPYDNLIIVSFSTSTGGGNISFWLGDGLFHPLSQTMDVAGLAVDGTANILYAATARGIMYRSTAGPYTAAAWSRLGDKTIAFSKVWVPAEGVIYALSSGSNNGPGTIAINEIGVNGVWRYTIVDGWKRIVTNENILDASGGDTELYYYDSQAPATLTYTTYPSAGTPRGIVMPLGVYISGLDFDGYTGKVVIRTELGSTVFKTVSAGVLADVDSSGSLTDGYGALSPNKYLGYSGAINGKAVSGFVAADRGIYWRSTPTGQFAPTDGQSGIQDVNATFFDVGAAMTVMGRVCVPLAAAGPSLLRISMDGGLHWIDVLAQNVDAVAAWYEGIREATGEYPGGEVAAFGSNPGYSSDPEGDGTIVHIDASAQLGLPDGWICARRWTNNMEFTVRLDILDSKVPYNQMKPLEDDSIQADASRGALDASSAVLTAMYRTLAQASVMQSSFTCTVVQLTQEARIRTALLGDAVLVNANKTYLGADRTTTTVMLDYSNTKLYIASKKHRIGESGESLWDLVLVNAMTWNLLDISKILSALANGQAKSRRLKGTNK